MREGKTALRVIQGLDGTRSERWTSGRTRFTPGNHRAVAVFLALGLLAPWVPAVYPEPPRHPSHRAPGRTRVPVVKLAFSPDGRILATADESGLVTLRQAAEGWGPGRVVEVRGHARPIAFTPDGRHLVIGGDEPGVDSFELGRGVLDRLPDLPFRLTLDLKISPDGRILAASGLESHEIVVRDLESGRERMRLRGHSAPAIHLAFAPDGRSLASAAGIVADRPIRIWDLDTGRPRRILHGMPSGLLAIAYSPDGRRVAGASTSERAVRIWDVDSGAPVMMLAGPSSAARALAYSPGGRLLATAAGDGTATLWDVATGRELRRLDGQTDVLRQVAFSPDGMMLAATGNDGDIRFWDLDELFADR